MKRRNFLAAVSVLVAAALVAACGGNSGAIPSPAGPSSPSTPAAVTGATITGTVQGLASSASVGARDVITVTVAGTTITATIDGQGTFVLKGVPAGTVTLTFSGTSATVTLQNVGQSGQIKIVVVISGSTATVETDQRVADGQAELEGRISEIGAAANTFSIGSTLVTVPAGIPIRHGDATVLFSALQVGDRVHVKGTAGAMTSGTTLASMTATEVIVQNTNPRVPVNLKGAVSNVTGSCSATTQFKVEGWLVKADAGTSFQKGACGDLKAGADVHVKGDVVPATTAVAVYVQATWVQFGK